MSRLPEEILITEAVSEDTRVRRRAGRPQRGSLQIILPAIEVRK
jgi:hypothetical protein